MLLLGIDDSGRGPLIGPMILSGILIKKEHEPHLRKIGARDSKLLSHPERIRISKLIKKSIIAGKIVLASPAEIDDFVLLGKNLNALEAKKMAEVINELNDGKKPIKVIIDCPSINVKKWQAKLVSFIKNPGNLTILCEHKADFNHPVVSAASILAKVAREDEVAKIKKEFAKLGNIGSGYPSDPITQEFLKKHGKELANSGIFRKSWATWKQMFPEDSPALKKKGQKTLGDY